uniref:Secreted protein n=1 Tax=Anopheles christyi TaxID=43041 RepID=A0A182KIQ3_9DIPT
MRVLLLLLLLLLRCVISSEPGWMYTLLIRHTSERGGKCTVVCHFVCIVPSTVEMRRRGNVPQGKSS